MINQADNPVSTWRESFEGEMSEGAIRSRYNSVKYRVSRYASPKNTNYPGSMRAGRCFVLEGAGKYFFKNFEITLSAGEFADLPEGNFRFETMGDRDFVSILVWELPAWIYDGKER